MKKIIYIITTLLCLNGLHSQVLYNENFNSYATGSVGTNFTGATSGKGGWLTYCFSNGTQCNNNLFNINIEANRGNVLTLSAGTINPINVSLNAKKIGLETLINQRTPSNNVLKFEIDYYTGAQLDKSYSSHQIIALSCNPNNNVSINNDILVKLLFNPFNGKFDVSSKDHKGATKLSGSILPFNTWVTYIVYLDYNNKKAYFEVPYFNTIGVTDFLKTSTSTNLIEDFKPTTLSLSFAAGGEVPSIDKVNKYDNIKITGLKSVPAYVLNTESFLAAKFNLYPNPATNVVNITNNENMLVEQITVYDISGKQLNTQCFNSEVEIQLNVESLVSGTYMLYLQTKEGIAVKKLVKK